jgi:hypothetical protein
VEGRRGMYSLVTSGLRSEEKRLLGCHSSFLKKKKKYKNEKQRKIYTYTTKII